MENANEFLLCELRKFRSDYSSVCKAWGNLCARATKYRDFLEKDLSIYLNEKLMPAMFSNIVKKHEVIMPLQDSTSYVLVATPKGLRYKWHSSSHSTNLPLYMINDAMTKDYDVVEKWFAEHLNKKRVAVLRQFKEAFVKDFNPLWARKSNYEDNSNFSEFRLPIGREFFFISRADVNGADIKDKFFVKEIIVRLNVSQGEVSMAFVTDKFENETFQKRYYYGSSNDLNKFVMWEDNNFLSMFSFREIMNEVSKAIKLADGKLEEEELAIQNWFVNLKQNLSAYVSLITL